MRNQQHFSNRSEVNRRAMHSQMRDPDCSEAFAANDNERPWTADDAAAMSRWADSRASEPEFATVVGWARSAVASWRQENRPRVV